MPPLKIHAHERTVARLGAVNSRVGSELLKSTVKVVRQSLGGEGEHV